MPQTASVSHEKADLRADLKARRQALPPETRKRLSAAAADHILHCQSWQKAEKVALYIAVRGETLTDHLLEDALATGKEVLLPLCSRHTIGEMEFVPCSDPDRLRPGVYGIPEPFCAEPSPPHPPTPPEIIILPGIAFDRTGVRLGQGQGYYDRQLALPHFAPSLRLGLAYAFQLVDKLPRAPWDIPVHAICTEQGILWIAQA